MGFNRTNIPAEEFVKVWQREVSARDVFSNLRKVDRNLTPQSMSRRASDMRARGIFLQRFTRGQTEGTAKTRALAKLARTYRP